MREVHLQEAGKMKPGNTIQAALAEKGKGIAILFSGGLDSTLEAVSRLGQYEQVHLLTFNNGCCVNVDGSKRRIGELQRIHGKDRLHHVIVDTTSLRRKLLWESKGELLKFKSPLVFDLACKMAAVVELVYYARVHGLPDISDGASVDQTQIFLQDPEFGVHVKPLITDYGVRFMPPVNYTLSRDEKMALLREQGLKAGTKGLEKLHITSQLLHQPFCLYGFVTYFFVSPLRKLRIVDHFALPMEQAKAAWDAVLPIAREELDDRLKHMHIGNS
jgi:hypothetical protein